MRTTVVARDLPPVGVVGYGDVSPAIAEARGVDYRELARSLDEAIAVGIGMFDVDEDEDAERFMGEAIRAVRARDRVIASTRVTIDHRLDPLQVQLRVERALRATRLDALPLVRIPTTRAMFAAKPWLELAGGLARLQREGKVIAYAAEPDATFADVGDEPPPPEPIAADAIAEDDARPSSIAMHGSIAIPTAGAMQDLIALTSGSAAMMGDLGALRALIDRPSPAARAAPKPATSAATPAAARAATHAAFGDPFTAIVVTLSLCDRVALPIVDRAIAEKRCVLVRRPLAGGALGGSIGPGVVLTRTDDRRGMDLEMIATQLAQLARLVEIVPPALRAGAPIDRIAAPLERTVARLALRFAIDRSGGIAMPRLHRRQHLAEAIACAGSPALSPSTTEQIISTLDV